MDVLRRLRSRAGSLPPALGPAGEPLRAVRRVVAASWSSKRRPHATLRGPNRRLAGALEQLRDGVPLNWGQVEDDPELATLARLTVARQESRLQPITPPSAEFRTALVSSLKPTLRKPPPVRQPPKVEPKSLAGFSERVQVLTQVEDNVETGNNWLVFFAKAAAVVGAVVLAVWGVSTVLSLFSNPGFGWIELHRGKDIASRAIRARTWIPTPCRNQRAAIPVRPREYQILPEVRYVAELAGYHLPTIPPTLTEPITLTLTPLVAAIDLCNGPRSVSPPDRDQAAVVRIQYTAENRMVVAAGKVTGLGKKTEEKIVTGTLTVFTAYQQPVPLDIASGDWHEVKQGELHGVYWRGDPYRDLAGTQWLEDTGVLVVEKGDTLVTLIAPLEGGITEPVMIEIARRMSWDSH